MSYTPEQLTEAAKALDGIALERTVKGVWYLVVGENYAKGAWLHIGSDADLYDGLLDTMVVVGQQWPRLDWVSPHRGWRCYVQTLSIVGSEGFGPTKLAAVLACIAAMGAK